MTERKRALLVSNSAAGQLHEHLAVLVQQLQDAGVDLIWAGDSTVQNWREMMQRHRDRVGLVVVAGGDGTLNGVVQGLADTDMPLGILPVGTANVFARTLGISVANAGQVITGGHTQRVDLGWVNGVYFLNTASVGLTVSMTRRLSPAAKGRWGPFAYVAGLLRALYRAKPFAVTITTPGEEVHAKSLQVTVANGHYHRGRIRIAGESGLDDGRLDLVSFEVERWWQLVKVLPDLRHGPIPGCTDYRWLSGPEFQVVTDPPTSVDTDGELTTTTPATFRVVPRKLRVYVPSAGPTPS